MPEPGSQVPASRLRGQIASFLRSHRCMSVATVGPPGHSDAGLPHAATVFYAVDAHLRLVFLSKGTSRHGRHIKGGSPVAVAVADTSQDWRAIQGVQLCGSAEVLTGRSRASALTMYLVRFPFVQDVIREPGLADLLREVEVFRIRLLRASLTDNKTGLFGREVLEDLA